MMHDYCMDMVFAKIVGVCQGTTLISSRVITAAISSSTK